MFHKARLFQAIHLILQLRYPHLYRIRRLPFLQPVVAAPRARPSHPPPKPHALHRVSLRHLQLPALPVVLLHEPELLIPPVVVTATPAHADGLHASVCPSWSEPLLAALFRAHTPILSPSSVTYFTGIPGCSSASLKAMKDFPVLVGWTTATLLCSCIMHMAFWYASSLCGYSSMAISFPPLSQKVYFLGCIRGMGRFTKKNISSLLILCPSCIKIRDNLLDIWTVPKSTLFGIFYGDSDFVVERSFYDILSHCFCRFFDF